MRMRKKILLVGGGHAHLEFIKSLNLIQSETYDICLVSEDKYQYYSGMASGYLSNEYALEDVRVELSLFCQNKGVIFIQSRVLNVLPDEQKILLQNGEMLDYDYLSINCGSITLKRVEGSCSFSSKPLGQLIELKRYLLEPHEKLKCIGIIGGGAAGVEIALAVKGLCPYFQVDLMDSGDRLLKRYPKKASRYARETLNKEGINLLLNHRVEKPSEVYDCLVWATGSAPSMELSNRIFALDIYGFMYVNPFLQSTKYENIFGLGDFVSIKDIPQVPKNGVYAIRQAGILKINLFARIENRPLVKYKPQKTYLSIISIGKHLGILSYGKVVFKGKLAWKIKNLIDRNYMKSFR